MLEKIERALKGIRTAPEDEKHLQLLIAQCFIDAGMAFQREVQTSTGPVDFVIESAAIEVKIKGSAMEVTRQIIRYLEDDRFSEGIVITTKPLVLPLGKSGGKPIHVIDLWRNFL
jgi:predicted AAA+ superfamily ATPase